ncbi:PQQ-like beta-propeller repeat protein [Hydrogenibacillus sp. N12]|uniref:PQQ-like beta-propeller repeat protein n=1 Tax=Hydrogenibacillus sp. N12 TaxID=2866627 RepID=UPI001C7DB6ED|nr:PQQ-like beta-propeller repeat protein [Hydrogenibacillus sp. N12]
MIVVLKDFRGVAAFDKFRGELLWELDTEARVRGSVNILDDLICFTSGGEKFTS